MSEEFPFHQFLQVDKTNIKNDNILNSHNINNGLSDKKEFVSNIANDTINEINKSILGHIHILVGHQKYETYFRDNFRLLGIEGLNAIFEATTPFIEMTIKSQFSGILEDAIKQYIGNNFNYLIKTKNENRSEVKAPSFNIDLSMSQEDKIDKVESKYINHISPKSNIYIDTKKTFSNFIVGPSNNMAHASCMAIAKNPGKTYPSVYIHSRSGLGKTHLLHAVANQINNERPELRVILTSAQKFLQELISAFKNNNVSEFNKKYTEKLDVLIIDDIHELKNKQSTQTAFFNIFNDLYNKGKQLIFTSDKTPKEIDGIEERIKTRLSWGLVLDIQQPDLETRIAILERKAQEEDLYISNEVIHLIATSIKNNIRELEGSLIKLAAYSSIFNQEIDVEVAKRELKLDEIVAPKEYTLESITKSVSNHYKIPIADLKSKSRLKSIANARHISMYLIYKLTKFNLSEIGKFFGGRDHTTVLHAVKKIKSDVKESTPLSQDILKIETSL